MFDAVEIKAQAYKKLFGANTPAARLVLADLAEFCRADSPTADVENPYATYLAEGRREVWCRIQAHLNLSFEDINQMREDLQNVGD